MIRKVVAALLLIPLALLIVVFAVANRQPVTVSFDPFATGDPSLSATLPLYVLVILGVIVGGVAAWLRQHKWRRAARHAAAETRALRSDLAVIRNPGPVGR